MRSGEVLDLGDAMAVARVASLTGDAAVAAGVLSLTPAGASARRGALLLRAWERFPALRTLRVQFDLMAHGGGARGGRGVSFNYGPLDEQTPLDESGGEHRGLAVSFVRGASALLEVRLRGVLLLSRPIDDAWPRRVWSPVAISLSDGAGGTTSLAVRISGAEVLREGELVLPDWQPAPFWRVAFAARTPLAAGAADAYGLSELRIDSGSLAPHASVPVRVSLNGQQFSEWDGADVPRLTYVAPPVVSSVTPPLGPLGGGKVVLVRGANLNTGSALRVAFGELQPVVGSHDGPGQLRCLTPPGTVVATVEVRVSLNGAQYSGAWMEAPPGYAFHEPLETDLSYGASGSGNGSGYGAGASGSVLHPAFGPPLGGTIVFVNSSVMEDVTSRLAANLTSCRFGSEMVAATAGSDALAWPGVFCAAPPANASAALPLAVEVELSLNSQDFVTAAGGRGIYTYVPLHAASAVQPPLVPATGVDGESLVHVVGSGFSASATLLCRVGLAVVAASLADDGRVRCFAPPLGTAAALRSEHISLAAPAALPSLGGTAALRDSILALTNLTRNSAGSFRLPPRVLPPPYAADAPPAFRVSFAVRVWGGGGVSAKGASWSHGDGFSLSYGQVCICMTCARRVHSVYMARAWQVHGVCVVITQYAHGMMASVSRTVS